MENFSSGLRNVYRLDVQGTIQIKSGTGFWFFPFSSILFLSVIPGDFSWLFRTSSAYFSPYPLYCSGLPRLLLSWSISRWRKGKRQQSKPVPAAPSAQFSGSEVDEIFPSKDPKSKGKNLRPYAGNTSCSWPNWGNLNTFPHFYLILQIPSLSESSNPSFLQEFQATQTSKGRLKELKDDITLLCSGSLYQAQSDVWTRVWQNKGVTTG